MQELVTADAIVVDVEIDGEAAVGELLESNFDEFFGVDGLNVCHSLFLSKIQILALERRKNVEKTLVDILSDTTEQSVSPSFTVTNEWSAQKAASIFFGEESND